MLIIVLNYNNDVTAKPGSLLILSQPFNFETGCVMRIFACLFQNIRIIAKYYTQLTLERMAELLDWPVDVSWRSYRILVNNSPPHKS